MRTTFGRPFKIPKRNKRLKKVALIISLIASILFASMAISEYYIVAIKKETELYPFGGDKIKIWDLEVCTSSRTLNRSNTVLPLPATP